MTGQTTSTATDAGQSAASNAKPTVMQGNEFLYGHLVAGVIIAVAVVNLVVRHGSGAPKHPQTGLSIAGLVAAIAVLPVLRIRNRFMAAFGALIAALIVTLPNGPSAVRELHALVIVFPFVYAFLLTQRQRKASLALAKAGGSARQAAQPRTRRSRRKQEAEEAARPKTPGRNRRYTPPKAKRAKP